VPYSDPIPVELAFPVAGVDRSLPSQKQPQLTTHDALNVEAFAPLSDRLGGGKRAGLSKALQDIAGTASSRRVTSLTVLREGQTIIDPDGFSIVAVSEDWSAVTPADPADLRLLAGSEIDLWWFALEP